ncbi:hypothetical protein CSB45_13755 [candidate division KSB3 bacterium]|uniref:Septum formation initiator n=1 Tax=candidate division KSB3 bacterium TaxID=2044937 RepID=A0A2G6E2A4_9BACT|nr:MAG: hypothetical protein CSB45_13755 [candidate division KSB3 bacterium]PIE28527.1 MAG: hypothetical protein CSA57_13565 [candidate division KSB3 bacterium]
MIKAQHRETRFASDESEIALSLPFRLNFGLIGSMTSAVLLGVMILALLSPENGLPKVRQVQEIKRKLEIDIQLLDAENERLRHDIQAMKHDPFQQEKIAREELNMALPGEIVYKFTE